MSPRKIPLTEPCTMDDCTDVQKARGLCNRHLLRLQRYGDAHGGQPLRTRSDAERAAAIWQKVEKPDGEGGCWTWAGPRTASGYGNIRYGGGQTVVHRVVYTLLVRPLKAGEQLDHLCHTRDANCRAGKRCPHRLCVNPAHLEPVTAEVNKRRSRRSHCARGHEYDHVAVRRGHIEQHCYRCINERRRRIRKADAEAKRKAAA